MSSIPDPIRDGLARGWKVLGGPHGKLPETIDCDVAIIGSGAGAGITAEILARAGMKLVIIEEGPLKSSSDFRQREAEAYAQLYQEGAGRKTADQAMNILQGRCVGGTTVVNWTSSFRTPPEVLAHWDKQFGLADLNEAAMAPWFAQAEERLGVSTWAADPNVNNTILKRGAEKLGIKVPTMRRNVKACWNLGSCGLGCPTNAKQSMLITTIPVALDHGATLLVQTRAQAFDIADGKEIRSLRCQPVALDGAVTGADITVKARHYVLAGGAINSPGLLLRSKAPDPHGVLGRRTFLHPTVATAARMDEEVAGWNGAPQSVYSDHYLHEHPLDGPLGYKLEVPPIHPAFALTNLGGLGREMDYDLAHTQIVLALLRDGFHPRSVGGTVKLRGDGTQQLDYPLDDTVMEAVRRAHLAMGRIQFAAGAKAVRPIHERATYAKTVAELEQMIAGLDYKPYLTRVGSAHVMGGCGMAGDAKRGVTKPDGQHWQLANLSVHDGSLFPTSLGVNPQLSIYGLVNRLSAGLAQRLGAKPLPLA